MLLLLPSCVLLLLLLLLPEPACITEVVEEMGTRLQYCLRP